MRGLYGRRRRRAAAAQRVPHEAAGRRGGPGAVGHAHAEGRHERGAARLGHQRARHLLLHRHGRRARIPIRCMVRDFQSIIGDETRAQMQEAEGRLPDALVACIGGGSNAMGLFHPFLDDPTVEIYRRRSGGPWAHATARRLDHRRPSRRAARQPHLSAAGRRRPDPGRPFDLGRPRLSRHRPRAFLAARDRPRHLSLRDR